MLPKHTSERAMRAYAGMTDKHGVKIREGDSVKETFTTNIEDYEYKEVVEFMGGKRLARVVNGVKKVQCSIIREVKKMGGCFIMERVSSSPSVHTSPAFHYINGCLDSEKFEIINQAKEQ